MRNAIKLSIVLVLLIGYGNLSKAQYVLKEADDQFNLYNYTNAIELYTAAYQKKKSLHAIQRLAESYSLIQDYKQAESWYALLVNTAGSKPEAVLNYGKALQHNAKYSEAKIQYQKYAELNPSVTLEQKSFWLQSCDSAVKWMQNPKNITVNNEKTLNSAQSDWGTTTYDNGLVFASDRTNKASGETTKVDRPFLKFDGTQLPDKRTYGWTGNDYLQLYQQASRDDSVHLFPLRAGTNYHMGSASFSADGKYVILSITRIPNRIVRKKEPSTINIELFAIKMDSLGKWGTPEAFRYNKVNEYSVGDPYLSRDGKTLYFVSNMPGGKGGTDIYKCERNSDGSWADAQNLASVNTAGNERSPTFDHEGGFYFCTDGLVGMGGLDIFKVDNGGQAINMGYPLNSPQDDFAFATNNKTEGYLSSNRANGLGSDDIYSYVNNKIIAFMLEGIVYDKDTNQPLQGAIVTLTRSNGNTLKTESDLDGSYKFGLDAASDYTVFGVKTAYRASGNEALTTKGLKESATIKRDLYLTKIVIGKPIKIENIYYDFDKSNIRADAAVELDKLVAIMKENPTIWIELGSHTDSRGGDQYNQWLSQSRANSAVQYIIDNGIEKSRITAKGYGESVPVNGCVNGVKCSEADHQLNRRTEFTIVKQ